MPLQKIAAFSDVLVGGNPAGVWTGDALPPPAEMQRIAAGVGFSETAFAAPPGSGGWRVRCDACGGQGRFGDGLT